MAAVWKLFNRIGSDKNKATCNDCNKEYSILLFLGPTEQLCKKITFPTYNFDKIFRRIFGQKNRISEYIRLEQKNQI